jgi:hypothetical protein
VAVLRLVGGGQPGGLNGRGHFFAAAEAMRRILVEAVQAAKAELVKLRYFAGLSLEGAAVALSVSPAPPAAGALISDRYRLIEPVGEGGSGPSGWPSRPSRSSAGWPSS